MQRAASQCPAVIQLGQVLAVPLDMYMSVYTSSPFHQIAEHLRDRQSEGSNVLANEVCKP